MARTGRPTIPTEQKRLVGTLRADRMPAKTKASLSLVPAADPAAHNRPPTSLVGDVYAAGSRWLASTDSLALALLRESLEEREALRAEIVSGMSEDRKGLRELDRQIILQMSALGFDPAARSRLGLSEVKAADKIDKLLDRKARRDVPAP